MFPLVVLAWVAFWNVTLITPQVASEVGKGFKGEELDISLACHHVYP